MPTITVSTNAAVLSDSLDFETAVLILGKNRNFIKNELSKNINVFQTRIFTDIGFLNDTETNVPTLIIIAGDDRAKAIEIAILCLKIGIKAVILTEKPIHAAEKFAESVITVGNAELAECIAAVLTGEIPAGASEFHCGTGETPLSAAAQVFSKLPEGVCDMIVFTNAPKNEAAELFSLIGGNVEVLSEENDSDGYCFNVFLKSVTDFR
jgi:hypothetical protein